MELSKLITYGKHPDSPGLELFTFSGCVCLGHARRRRQRYIGTRASPNFSARGVYNTSEIFFAREVKDAAMTINTLATCGSMRRLTDLGQHVTELAGVPWKSAPVAQATLYPVGQGPSVIYGTSGSYEGGTQVPEGINCAGVGIPNICSMRRSPLVAVCSIT